jgi:hypothetical protein
VSDVDVSDRHRIIRKRFGVLQARRPHGSDKGNGLVFGAGLDRDIGDKVAANRLD